MNPRVNQERSAASRRVASVPGAAGVRDSARLALVMVDEVVVVMQGYKSSSRIASEMRARARRCI